MKISKNNYTPLGSSIKKRKEPKTPFFLIGFTIFLVSFLFLLNVSFVGASTNVYYTTECEEKKDIGDCKQETCRRTWICTEEEWVCTETSWVCTETSWCEEAGEDVCTAGHDECTDGHYRCTDGHWRCDEKCKECSCYKGTWTEYEASATGCNPNIHKRECQVEQTGDCRLGNCKDENCVVKCDPWEVCENCKNWQIAERIVEKENCLITEWGFNRPQCRCDGLCLQAPITQKYFNNPNYPGNLTPEEIAERRKGPNDILLPVKMDWDNIEGWRYNIAEEKKHPWWYKIEMTHISQGIKAINTRKVDSEKLNISGYNPRKFHGPCFLHSNSAYKWKTKACCYDIKNQGCGEWSENWQFNTNHAPEPISPIDPDWVGKELIPGQPLEVELKWCDVYFEEEKPKSFKLFFYLGDEPGEEETIIRHPRIGESPKILSDRRFDEPEPIFRNEKYGFFTKPPFTYKGMAFNFYAWRVAACEDFDGWGQCADFSQKWRFSLDEGKVLEIPELRVPPNNIKIPVGLPVLLRWSHALGAKSYILEIRDKAGTLVKREIISGTSRNINHPLLSIDTIYQWRIMACSCFEGIECSGKWSEEWNFKTTGQPPRINSMKPMGLDIIIPATFSWEDVPGAKSYIFRIQGPEPDLTKFAEKAKTSLGFPNLQQETNYSWQIKTCARLHSELCGDWSSPQAFTTFKLGAPINPFPENNKEIYTYQMPKTFSWNPVLGARHYKIIISQPDGKIKQEIVADNSVLVNFHYLGTYQWQIQACLDENCQGTGNPVIWNFTLSDKEAPEKFRAGLVPCGRKFDNPDTEWRETEPCQIKHIFILLYLVLNFVLWTIIPLALVILVAITGIMFYFSLSTGTTETLPKIKALWKSAGMGFGIIFLGWNVICFILTLFGYQTGIFGLWWHIPF